MSDGLSAYIDIFVCCFSTYSGKVFQVTFLSLGCFLLLPLMVVVLLLESPIHPEAFRLDFWSHVNCLTRFKCCDHFQSLSLRMWTSYLTCSLKEPPLMQGCWEPNLKLREAQRLFEDQIIGPESIANIGGLASAFQFCFCFWLWLNWRMLDHCVCRCFILRNSWREDYKAGRSKTLYSNQTWKTALWWEKNM